MKRISKTIIILVLFAWIGNGINVEAQQRRPHYDRPVNRSIVMNKHDFEFLYKIIKQKSFKDDRLELLSEEYWTIISVADNASKSCLFAL